MDHGIFFEFRDRIVQLPVNPKEITFQRESNNETAEIIGLGEINRLGIVSLAECSFESFFPSNRNQSFVRTRNTFRTPAWHRDFFERVQRTQAPSRIGRLVITNTGINMLASVEDFTVTHQGAEGDIHYSINFKEYRSHQARRVTIRINKPQAATTSSPRQPSTNKKVTVGARVIVNGRLHRDSFGTGPGLTEVNATRVVNFIAPGRSHPYHVTLVGGGWRGWVTAGSVRVI